MVCPSELLLSRSRASLLADADARFMSSPQSATSVSASTRRVNSSPAAKTALAQVRSFPVSEQSASAGWTSVHPLATAGRVSVKVKPRASPSPMLLTVISKKTLSVAFTVPDPVLSTSMSGHSTVMWALDSLSEASTSASALMVAVLAMPASQSLESLVMLIVTVRDWPFGRFPKSQTRSSPGATLRPSQSLALAPLTAHV